MSGFLRQSTAGQVVQFGPFLDDTDFKTPETALTIANTDIKLRKHAATTRVSKNSGGATHLAAGDYHSTFDATDSNTVGLLDIRIDIAGALPVFDRYMVLEEAAYDFLYASGAKPGMVWDALMTDHFSVGGSFGEYYQVLQAILDASISSRSSHNPSDVAGPVWSYSNRQLTNLGANAVADVWAALTANLTAANSIGKLLTDRIDALISSRMATFTYTAPPSAGAIADQVWDEQQDGHLISGSFGNSGQNAFAAANVNLDVNIGSRASQASVNAIPVAKLIAHAATVLVVTIGTGSTTTTVKLATVEGAAPSGQNDVYNGAVLILTSGPAVQQRVSITDYDGATTTATVSALTVAPANGNTGVIV